MHPDEYRAAYDRFRAEFEAWHFSAGSRPETGTQQDPPEVAREALQRSMDSRG